MADEEGPQAPAPQGAHDPQALQNPLPPQNRNNIIPNAPQVPEAPHPPALNMLALNRSHFKPEYLGKPDEDAEAHLLRRKNRIDTHGFQDHIKVQRFCLTLTLEARLCYKSLR